MQTTSTAALPTVPAGPRSLRSRLPLGVLPIPALAAIVVTVHVTAHPTRSYDPDWLVLLGSTVLIAGVGLAVSAIAARNYRATGRAQTLLLGSAVLTFGLAAAAAAVVRVPNGANVKVTIYNVGALLAALLHSLAAFLLLAGASPEVLSRRRRSSLVVAYGGVALVVGIVTCAAAAQALPPFFVHGAGATPVRQAVLGTACILFAFSTTVFAGTYLRTREVFLGWYTCALAATAISLAAFLLQQSVGTLVGWTGRVSQYVGGVYFLVALVTAARTAQHRGTSLDHVLTASLSGAEETFRALAENVPDVIRRFDRELRHVYVNFAGQRLYGKPAGALVGKRVEQVLHAGAEAAALNARVERVFRTGERIEVEERLSTPRGVAFYQSVCVPEYAADGTVANVLVVSRDLTEYKRAEEALLQADRRKDEFLGMLSHELRNPLGPIRNSTYVLRHVAPGSDQATRAREVIERQTEHLTRLVDDLLDVTRIARGKIELRRERVDLREIVSHAADDFRMTMRERGTRFEVELPDEPLRADADRTRLAQLLGNLLHNAAKFTRPGDEIALSLALRGGAAEVRVRDTGAGIEPALLPRVFDAFVQGERTLARTEGGLGLGLALVKGIAELHGGAAFVESAGKGKGSEFIVRVPLAAAAGRHDLEGPRETGHPPGAPSHPPQP